MSKTTHTPGPLVVDHNSDVPDAPRFRVFSKAAEGNVGLFYSEADARLFAIAPDMLALIRDAITEGGQEGRWLDADGTALDSCFDHNTPPDATEWPGATWEPYTAEEQTNYLFALADRARRLLAKLEA